MMKKYAFMIFIIVLAVVMFAAAYFIEDDSEEVVYTPKTDLEKPAPIVSAEPDELTIRRTQLVYFYNDSEVFHIEPDCSGMGIINGRPCGQALDMGIKPCSRCMKDYIIK